MSYQQVNLDGLTGSVHFNEHGNRKGITLEILNLQNDSFRKVNNSENRNIPCIMCFWFIKTIHIFNQLRWLFTSIDRHVEFS